MATLTAYPVNNTPKASDLLLGTKVPTINSDEKPITSNVTIAALAALINSGSVAGYKTYTALLTQAGTAAPVATILQNTTSETFTWTRQSGGNYTITASSALFIANKTMVFLNAGHGYQAALPIYWERTSDTTITLLSFSDGEIEEGSFEIRIYS
tara:strand:+ start:22 stop:486 length:465 start_codon:yes stop_codon:yes gene_type:complete